jgi:cyclic pyranopterin monophosphate synthase
LCREILPCSGQGCFMSDLTHFDEKGQALMVDVGGKDVTVREAVARGEIRMQPETLDLIMEGRAKKGDVLGVARIAGIMASKKTPDLIPLAHPLPVSSVRIEFFPDRKRSVVGIEATVKVTARTGVEMEALTAVAVAGLTIYDMCKAVDRCMVISEIRLMEKSGGRSGHFRRE